MYLALRLYVYMRTPKTQDLEMTKLISRSENAAQVRNWNTVKLYIMVLSYILSITSKCNENAMFWSRRMHGFWYVFSWTTCCRHMDARCWSTKTCLCCFFLTTCSRWSEVLLQLYVGNSSLIFDKGVSLGLYFCHCQLLYSMSVNQCWWPLSRNCLMTQWVRIYRLCCWPYFFAK